MLYPVSDRHVILMNCLPCVLFDSARNGVSFLFICKITDRQNKSALMADLFYSIRVPTVVAKSPYTESDELIPLHSGK